MEPISRYAYAVKMTLWKWGFEFDKEDAKIVIPVILLLLALTLTPLNKVVLWSGGVVYYLLYFFLKPTPRALKEEVIKPIRQWFLCRCPHCKSHDIFEQGLSEYHGDVPYYWYQCNHCGKTSILINSPNERFIKPGPGRGAKELQNAQAEPPF